MKTRNEAFVERISTGLDRLDALLGGGFQRGSLILLAGEPGVGKTVFCANFIYSGWLHGEKGVYASFGENKQTFLSNMRNHLGEAIVRCFNEGGCEYLDLLSVSGDGVAATLQAILDVVNKIGAKRLVIDSFNPLSLALKDPLEVRIFLHSVVGKIVRQLGCTTILVKEVPSTELKELGVEEYVSDVIMQLKTDVVDERWIRIMELKKARGSRSSERFLAYTLDKGFKTFTPIINPFIVPKAEPQRWQPTPDSPSMFSTGIPELDDLVGGGFPKGSAALLEVDSAVASEQYFPLIISTAANFLAKGRPVVLTLPLGIIPSTIEGYVKICGFTDEEINKLMRIGVIEGQYPEEEIASKGYIWSTKPKNLLENIDLHYEMIAELKRRAKEKGALTVIALDTLYSRFGLENLLLAINRYIAYAVANKDLTIFLLKPGLPSKALYQSLYSTAELHLRIFRKYGVLFIYGVKPRTLLYAIEVGERSFLPRLIPIV